jgi:hypothetical protein
MELSLAMRYCLVQTQKAASGNLMCAEQLYAAILSLYEMEPEEIILETEHHKQINADLKAVARYVMIHNLDVNATCECITDGLKQDAPSSDAPAPNTDVPGLLECAGKCAEQAGHKAIMAADLLEVLEATSFVSYYLQTIEDLLEVKNVSNVKYTDICLIPFRGGPLVAVVKYYILCAALAVFFYLSDNFFFPWVHRTYPSETTSKDTSVSLSLLYMALLLPKGVASLIALRFKAFSLFFDIVISIVMCTAIVVFYSHNTPTLEKVLLVLFSLCALFGSAYHLHDKEPTSDRQTFKIYTMMLKVCGTPDTIFFGYLLRAFIIPYTAFSIIWIWNLHPNAFWRAAFWIYGYIAIYDTLRVLLGSIWLTSKSRLVDFLESQLYLLGLPGFGLFLMWYFHWLPMPFWLFVLYLLYGVLIWLPSIIISIMHDPNYL